MGQFLTGRKTKWTDPRTRPGYVSPFTEKKMSPQEKKVKELAKWEAVAKILKKQRGYKQPVKDIAAELYSAEQRRKNK